MSFFDLGSMKAPQVTLDKVRDWASEIASGYLTLGTAPTQALIKIARSEDLAPHQVENLAGETNKKIHQLKFASAEDKYLAADFPLADAKLAIAALQASGEVKLAGLVPDPVFDNDVSGYDLFGIAPPEVNLTEKTASLKTEMRQAGRRADTLREKIAEEACLAKFAADDAELAFIKEARQMVLQNTQNQDGRMNMLGDLGAFVATADMADIGRPMLAKLAYVLGREGYLLPSQVKVATDFFMSKEAMPVPDELISPFLKCKVVNGSHPLYVTLKTVKGHVARMNHARGNRSIVDDHLEVFGERIAAL